MTNIISFEEARARREQAKLAVAPPAVQDIVVEPRPVSHFKGMTLSGGQDSLFLREARRFRFANMATPSAFVIMETGDLPLPFPPDPPSPLAA